MGLSRTVPADCVAVPDGGPAPALVVPGDVDSPSGGNVWDRQVRDALAAAGSPPGWHPVPGSWPAPSTADARALDEVLTGLADGAPVLVDGLVAGAAPDVVVPHARRLRLGVVLHLPLASETGLDAATADARDAAERRVLAAADVVVVPSRWAAGWLEDHRLRRPPVVATPGTTPAPSYPDATLTGAHLLCLGAVSPRKGQRRLLEALDGLDLTMAPDTDLGWELRLVGPHPQPDEVGRLRSRVEAAGLGTRVVLTGPLVGEALEEQWRWADLLVVPSAVETFGMVVTEALARGRPVLATTGSALPEALGTTPTGPPGLLVAPGDTDDLADALHRWLGDADLRTDLRARARARAGTLSGWDRTADAVREAFR
ncbi:glycosyltransferase family 4 protein [Aquipuribacter sp. MA13-6]|uniref:glycosyltransferase family 4 protein n=1 Tax=unclassified Aquipuribacter TaxID=2635084 RepID=UPI003EE9314D